MDRPINITPPVSVIASFVYVIRRVPAGEKVTRTGAQFSNPALERAQSELKLNRELGFPVIAVLGLVVESVNSNHRRAREGGI
jgi:hypothetical protein